jgi:hypothetical protein
MNQREKDEWRQALEFYNVGRGPVYMERLGEYKPTGKRRASCFITDPNR